MSTSTPNTCPDSAIPEPDSRFVMWRGRLTHLGAIHTPTDHRICVGGWIASGEWWLHCGTCRPIGPQEAAKAEGPGHTTPEADS